MSEDQSFYPCSTTNCEVSYPTTFSPSFLIYRMGTTLPHRSAKTVNLRSTSQELNKLFLSLSLSQTQFSLHLNTVHFSQWWLVMRCPQNYIPDSVTFLIKFLTSGKGSPPPVLISKKPSSTMPDLSHLFGTRKVTFGMYVFPFSCELVFSLKVD